MKNLILSGAAALAFAVTPAGATAQTATHDHSSMSEQQMDSYESWPPERRAEYDRWPEDYRVYFWTLDPSEQSGWWALDNDQRATVYAMTPAQRARAWATISGQMERSKMARSAMGAGDMRFVRNAVVQPISMDQAATDGGEVPICGPNEYDNCMNAWEAGKRGPNVTKPLGYWPGHTADPRAGE